MILQQDKKYMIKETERFDMWQNSYTINTTLPYYLLLLWTNQIVVLQYYHSSDIPM